MSINRDSLPIYWIAILFIGLVQSVLALEYNGYKNPVLGQNVMTPGGSTNVEIESLQNLPVKRNLNKGDLNQKRLSKRAIFRGPKRALLKSLPESNKKPPVDHSKHYRVRVPYSSKQTVPHKILPNANIKVQSQKNATTTKPKGTKVEVSTAKPNVTSAMVKGTKGAHSFTRQELEKALYTGVKCGTVPIFEKLYHRSINETYDKNPDGDDGDFRILHGLNALPGEWPWIARVSLCEDEDCGKCTATLLNSRWLITAGHCGVNKDHVDQYRVTLGLYDLVSPDKSSFTVKIDKLIVHPDYKELTNDILLMRLKEPVKFSDHIQPACFVRATRNILDHTRKKKCYAVGYGLTDGMVQAVKLQKLQIETKSQSDCNSDKLDSVRLKRGTVCVGPPEGKLGGSCKGDSGGPNLCYDPKNGQWEIFATVSYGPSDCDRDDHDKWHTVSVDLSNFRTWILSTILLNS